MSTVDKSAVGLGERQYHIGIAPGEVSTVALLPGDPFRVPLIAEFLTDVRDIAHQREHRTMTGLYKGRRITATSTGMGCPSTAIAAEELIRVGVTSLIRVGSTAAVQPGVRPGDLLVSEGTLRNDGTTAAYVHPGYPAVPDLPITVELERQAARIAEREGVGAISGLNASDDAFYAEGPEWIDPHPHGRHVASRRVGTGGRGPRLRREGILNIEMESSALFVVARLRGVRAAMICACSSNLVDGASLYSGTKDALQAGWAASIEAALETAVALEL